MGGRGSCRAENGSEWRVANRSSGSSVWVANRSSPPSQSLIAVCSR
ncbi:MAG: hypothetical protein SQA66_08665 [Candidatus Fervidibacter sacchari]